MFEKVVREGKYPREHLTQQQQEELRDYEEKIGEEKE